MWLITGGLLCALAIFPNFIETSPVEIDRVRMPVSIDEYGVAFYRNKNGYLKSVQGEGFCDVALDKHFVIGIYIGEKIYAIYDGSRKQIFLAINANDQLVHTRHIPQSYQHYFVRLHSPTDGRSRF
ncbi:uncharacterized protein LOC117179086 [Belonocnema kinseyi]|uniref:uncharacterized protein LOC117179086 n=1 Tax=Belonocnema kinseyi TaxID=2817044 RepID=UPI00143CC9F5|nr:uncharacterized protein LOC117179086 [Belonocnema kinseyi]